MEEYIGIDNKIIRGVDDPDNEGIMVSDMGEGLLYIAIMKPNTKDVLKDIVIPMDELIKFLRKE